MMRTLDLWSTQREAAERLENGLLVLRRDLVAMIWNPKGTKPAAHYRFRSNDQRDEYISQYVTNYDAAQAAKADRKQQKVKATTEGAATIGVGQVFVYSWGYDQTNVQYFQVTEKHGLMLTLLEIEASTVPDSAGFMSAQVEPRIGHFFGEPLRKRLQFTGDGQAFLTMASYGWCSLWRGGPHYSSWYA